MYVLLLLWKSRSIIKSVRKEGRKEGRKKKKKKKKKNKVALLWLRAVHPLLALWKVSMQLEYCLREPLSKFEGKYFLLQLYKREHFVLHIWDIRPIPTIRTTVRII